MESVNFHPRRHFRNLIYLRFQSAAEPKHVSEIRHWVVLGLTHLFTANQEHGFKHCLPIAHHNDPRMRTIFCRAFARVLYSNPRFEPPAAEAEKSQRDRLCNVSFFFMLIFPVVQRLSLFSLFGLM